MTVYELWKAGALDAAANKKLLKYSVPVYCKLYESFKELRASYRYEESLELAAISNCTSVRTVKRAISLVSK
jgi:hypothetical protein